MDTKESLFSLQDKIAIVTGGYRGLGASISEALGAAGAKVYVNGRTADRVDASVRNLVEGGVEAYPLIFDITDESAAEAAVATVSERHGKIDILVNNAGIHRRNPLLEMSLEDFRSVLDTNLTAAFIMGKAAARSMVERGSGKIINICSLMSELARPTVGNYAAAKGGLKMLTRSMAAEWGERNVQVNGIAPGYFVTEMTQPLKDDPVFDKWITGRTPSRRWGTPDDLKGVAVFLSSRASDYVNGQVLFVDGGLTAVV